jgi:hypothetical protein
VRAIISVALVVCFGLRGGEIRWNSLASKDLIVVSRALLLHTLCCDSIELPDKCQGAASAIDVPCSTAAEHTPKCKLVGLAVLLLLF